MSELLGDIELAEPSFQSGLFQTSEELRVAPLIARILQMAGLLPALRTYPKIGYHVASGRCSLVIDLVCPKCSTIYHSDLVHAGKWIKCPRCGELIPILQGGSLSGPFRDAAIASPKVPDLKSTTIHNRSVYKYGAVFVTSLLFIGIMALFLVRKGPSDSRVGLPVSAKTPQALSAAPAVDIPEPNHVFEVVNGDDLASVPSQPSHKLDSRQNGDRPPTSYRSLATGSPTCSAAEYDGRGVLRVENGTNQDADVRLFDSETNQVIRCFFVRAGDSAQVGEIPERTYVLRYSSGLDWDDREREFRWNPYYHQFEKEFVYTEVRVGNTVEYHDMSVTLHTVTGGNVRTHSISREQFLGNDREASSR